MLRTRGDVHRTGLVGHGREAADRRPDPALRRARSFGILFAASLALFSCSQSDELGPIGRVTAMRAPAELADARDMGCVVVGERLGTGLGTLELLTGGFSSFFQPRSGGQIDVVLLAEAHPSGDQGKIDVRFLRGRQESRETFSVLRESYEENDPDARAKLEFRAVEADRDGWIEGDAPSFMGPLPVLDDFFLDVELATVRLNAKLFEDGDRLEIKPAILTGYLSENEVRRLITVVVGACNGPSPPSVCAAVLDLLGDGSEDSLLDAFRDLLGGFDARLLEGGAPSFCAPEEDGSCNAASICLELGIEPADVVGFAQP